jgi:hypothetical protein
MGTASAVSAAPVQWEVASGGNGHWYEFVTSAFGFVGDLEALAEASTFMGMSGYLVTITSQAEQDFLNSIWPGPLGSADGERYDFGNNFAIGISDRDEEGVFRYIGGPEAGQIISYTNWNPDEPNDFMEGEDYALGWWENTGNGGWNDANFAGGGYIVEYSAAPSVIPVPGALPLLLSGLAAVGFTRLRRTRKA